MGREEQGMGIVVYAGLIHTFQVPTVEQQRRYSRDSSRSRVTGGRKGTTRFLGAQRTLVELYDELIVPSRATPPTARRSAATAM